MHAAQQVALMPVLKLTLERANQTLTASILDMRALFSEINRLYDTRKSAPTSPVKIDMPESPRVLEMCEKVAEALSLLTR
jgi:hypothetical protein